MFTWYKNEKYREPIECHNLIQVKGGPDTATSAKYATEVFCKNFGNLKKNTIISIQEMKDGEPIGEPIVPQEDTSIIPTKR
jgi:hypothetical protein